MFVGGHLRQEGARPHRATAVAAPQSPAEQTEQGVQAVPGARRETGRNPSRMNTYAKYAANPCRMRTYKMIKLKSPGMNTYKKWG
jgi:hypothetical protein